MSEPTEHELLRQQVMELASEIPAGRVISYGALGKRCDPPISGYVCGRIMSQILNNVPWWRVVGKDGALPISKRGPGHATQQRQFLEADGVEFDEDGKIQQRFFEE